MKISTLMSVRKAWLYFKRSLIFLIWQHTVGSSSLKNKEHLASTKKNLQHSHVSQQTDSSKAVPPICLVFCVWWLFSMSQHGFQLCAMISSANFIDSVWCCNPHVPAQMFPISCAASCTHLKGEKLDCMLQEVSVCLRLFRGKKPHVSVNTFPATEVW